MMRSIRDFVELNVLSRSPRTKNLLSETPRIRKGPLSMKTLLSLFAALVLCGAANLAAAAPAPATKPDKATYLRLAGEVEANLQKEILARWYPAALDAQHGGFHENYAIDWSPRPGDDRSIVYQSRLTWTAAQAAMRFPDKAEFYLKMTRHGAACLADKMWDKEHGGFYWSVDASGKPNLEGARQKQIYGVAFGLYALSTSYKVTHDEASLELAKKCFQWMEAHAHDTQNLGYYECISLDGVPLLNPTGAGAPSAVGARLDQKSMNSHIHILEALTALYQVWPDPAVKARVQEVFDLVRDKIYAEPGHLIQFLTLDWRPIPGPDSFGHDVETGFLLVEAAEALGRPDDERAWTAARRLMDHALQYGWDAEYGGLYDAGAIDAKGVVTGDLKTEKIWWVQAEQLNALLLLHERFGKETDKYWDAFLKEWEFITTRQLDHVKGGWFPYVHADGEPASKVKSDRWTECYHQARATLVVSERLRKLAEQGQGDLALNKAEYFEKPGLNVMVFHDYYPEGHQTGVTLIQHDVRVAANGDVRLEPTPGQWAPMPAVGKRTVNRETQEISTALSYPDPARDRKGFNPIEYPDLKMKYSVRVKADGDSFRIFVDLDEPLPAQWAGKVGFNFELFPGILVGKSYLMDGRPGGFPQQLNGPMRKEGEGDFQITPMAEGKRLVVAPEVDKQRLAIESIGGKLLLYDGRAKVNNGWFVVRSLVPAGKTKAAIEWRVTANVVPGWTYPPVVQVSQVGYHPAQSKIAIIELDKRETEIKEARLVRLGEDGAQKVILTEQPKRWGEFLRYQYCRFDFSKITAPGLYQIQYGDFKTIAFPIAQDVFSRNVWQPTLEAFLPVQMCHMLVKDRYRIWHGLCHDDDALMAPINANHFDGYMQGPSTLTKYKPLEHVPGLNAGGWHDAGDYDLRIESQADEVKILAQAYEEFNEQYDETKIDQSRKLVEMHTPDGKPDLLQQVEHGVLTIASGYRALGRFYRGIICPTLEQYTLLGDGSLGSDNRIYDAALKETETKGERSGKKDDNWVFTENNPGHELGAASALAIAARVLKDYNPELSRESLAIAEEVWTKSGEGRGKIDLAGQLFLTTRKDDYKRYILANAAALTRRLEASAALVAQLRPLLNDPQFNSQMEQAARALKARVDSTQSQNPYGVPYRPDIWGAGWDIQRFGVQQYYLHKAFPGIFGRDYMLSALNFVLGCHPGANTASFASGVGANSMTVAYGVNRVDWSYIPGGVGSGTGIIRPDLPELKVWPYFWQQGEYVMGGGASNFMFLALGANKILNEANAQ